MATVYKVEIEIVSDWVNFDEKMIIKLLKERIEINSILKLTKVNLIERT